MTLGTVENRLSQIERGFDGLKQEGLERKPSAKSGRQAVGAFPDDEFAQGAAKLGREWRELTNKAPAPH